MSGFLPIETSSLKEGYISNALILFIVFFASWAFIPDVGVINYITTIDVAAALIVMMYVVRARVLGDSLIFLYILFSVAIFIVSAQSEILGGTDYLRSVRVSAIMAPLLLLASKRTVSRDEFLGILVTAYVGLSISVLAGLMLNVLGIQMGESQQQLWLYGEIPVLRVAGLTGNTAEYGHVVAMWLLIYVYLYDSKSYRIVKILLPVQLLVAAYVVIYSSSRAAFVDIVVGLFVYGCIRFVRVRGGVTIIFLSLFFCIILYVIALYSLRGIDPTIDSSLVRLDFFGLIYSQGGLYDIRADTWKVVLENYNKIGYLGIGVKGALVYYGRYVDNSYLSILVECGLLGFALYISIIGVVVVRLWRGALGGDRSSMACLSMTAGFAAHSMTVDIHTLWASTPVFWAIVVSGLGSLRGVDLESTETGRSVQRQRVQRRYS